MTAMIALLRAVNVGGTGKLPMSELKAMCEAEGFKGVKTYIASGNVVFTTSHSPAQVQAALEKRLAAYAGKPVGVVTRTLTEMQAVAAATPFKDAPGNKAITIFLDGPPPTDTLSGIRGKANEEIALGTREIYVHYIDGQAKTKLVIPAAKSGTARNMNTVNKLIVLAEAL